MGGLVSRIVRNRCQNDYSSSQGVTTCPPGEESTLNANESLLETTLYERKTTVNRCGQPCGDTYCLENRRFKIDAEGKLKIFTIDQAGQTSWLDPSSLQLNGKERFAIRQCVYRDGKVYDAEGKEVALSSQLTEESFAGKSFAVLWGADKSPLAGYRVVITKAANKETGVDVPKLPQAKIHADAYTEPSPSDRLARDVISSEQVVLRERVQYRDQCGRCCVGYRNVSETVGNEDGKLVRVDKEGKTQPLDLDRYGITHLHYHEGKYFDSKSGAEVPFRFKADEAKLREKPFDHFIDCQGDGKHYFITAGLPEGKTVQMQQFVTTDCVRGADGKLKQEKIYSLKASVTERANAEKAYELSPDNRTLKGFEAVENGEQHPEFGKLRFVFRADGKDLIRVYENTDTSRTYDGSPVWTFAKRHDELQSVVDSRGCCFKEVNTSWVPDSNLSIKRDYNPPAYDEPPVLKEAGSPTGSTEAEESKPEDSPNLKTDTEKLSGEKPPESVPNRPLTRSPIDDFEAPREETVDADKKPQEMRPETRPSPSQGNQRAPLDVAGVDTEQALAVRKRVVDILTKAEEQLATLKASGLDEAQAWGKVKGEFWKSYRSLIEERTERSEKAARNMRDAIYEGRENIAGKGEAGKFTKEQEEALLKLADYFYAQANGKTHAELSIRQDELGADSEFFEKVIYRGVGGSYQYKYADSAAPAQDEVLTAFHKIARAAQSDYLLSVTLGSPPWSNSFKRLEEKSWLESRALLQQTLKSLERYTGSASENEPPKVQPPKQDGELQAATTSDKKVAMIPAARNGLVDLRFPSRMSS